MNEAARRFAAERERLFAALGWIPDGGVVEAIEHVGASSLPGQAVGARVELALAVWPLPLETAHLVALAGLGYRPVEQPEGGPPLRFDSADRQARLYFFEASSAAWAECVLLRDYAEHNAQAAQQWLAGGASEAEAASPWRGVIPASVYQAAVQAAEAWWRQHYGFGPVEAVGRLLQAFEHPWHIAGGWALDLCLGQVSRVHHDVDVVVPRAAQLALRQYLLDRGWKVVTPLDGRFESWPAHMRLELPRHQVFAYGDGTHIDFLLTDYEPGIWRYRRAPHIIRAAEHAGLTASNGLPYLASELVLLFKSRNTGTQARHQDEADFERVYPQLNAEQRAWLQWALTATSPGHPWLRRLAQAASTPGAPNS